MKLRHLEELLQRVAPFQEPDVELEQYPTSPHIASRVLFAADASFGDLEGKAVADFGCGTGMFAIGASVVGAAHVVGVDVDERALAAARANCDAVGVTPDLVRCDVAHFPTRAQMRAAGAGPGAATPADAALPGSPGRAPGQPLFDTVLMNPPFGTRVKGIDMLFLHAAFQVSGAGAAACMSGARGPDSPLCASRLLMWCIRCTRPPPETCEPRASSPTPILCHTPIFPCAHTHMHLCMHSHLLSYLLTPLLALPPPLLRPARGQERAWLGRGGQTGGGAAL